MFGAGGLGHEAGGLRPPLASPAPMARRTARHWYSALGSGFASRHGVFRLSFVYKSIVFPLFGSTDNSSSSLLFHHLLVSTLLIQCTSMQKHTRNPGYWQGNGYDIAAYAIRALQSVRVRGMCRFHCILIDLIFQS